MSTPDLNQSATNLSGNKRAWVRKTGIVSIIGSLVLGTVALSGVSSASAATSDPPVGLGTAASYSVLGGATVTNTGPTVLGQDVGVSPGTAITGFPPGVTLGTAHAADAVAAQAQLDLTTAYNDAASRATSATVAGDLVGKTLPGGVYTSAGTLDLSGVLTLDGQNDPNSVFVFQVASAFTSASASSVKLINGAQPCNVFWQVGSSATLGTNSTFEGTIMALTSISVNTGATVEGRALARNGQVSLDTNVFTLPGCTASLPSASPSVTPTVPPTSAPTTTATTPVVVPTTPATATTTPSTPVASPSTPVAVKTTTAKVTRSGTTNNGTTGKKGTRVDNRNNTATDTATSKSPQLAETGANTATPWLAGAGLFLLLGGMALVFSNRFSKVRRH